MGTTTGGIIILLAGTMPFILGLLTAIYWRSRKVYKGVGFWVAANFCLGLSYVLIGLRNHIPDFYSVFIGNVLAVYTLVLIYEGTETFFDRRSFSLLSYSILVLYAGFQLYLTYLRPNVNARVVLTSAALVILSLRTAYSLMAHSPAGLHATSRTVSLIFILVALFSAGRGILFIYQPPSASILLDPTLLAVAFGSICSTTVWTFYFLFLNTARVELDLQDSSEKLARSIEEGRRELVQLALLEETSQLIGGSLDERDILQHAVQAVVGRFGYAEAAISMLVEGDQLELMAVSGTEDIGYQLGYRQCLGEGIIGHVGETGQIYVTGEVEHDPYYFTIGHRTGSAAALPLLSEGRLYGVLYVESAARDAFSQTDLQTLRTLVGHIVTAINKARLHASTRDHLVVMTTLHQISQIITSSLELDRIFQTVLQLLKDTFGYTYVSIYLLEGDLLRLGAQIGYPDDLEIREIPITEGIVGRTVQTRQLQLIRDVHKEAAFLRAAIDIESEVCAPLFKKGAVMGVINVEAARGKVLTERDADVLTALTGPIAIAIENAELHARAKSLARIDGLTELLNRRTFDQTLESELARAARYDYPLTLLILDIDDFKACNDRWGHPAGDALLRTMARLIRSNIRSMDAAARYGGDEFAIILPNTSLADGLQLAERLRIALPIVGHRFNGQNIPPGDYTLSIGAASFPGSGRTAEELLVAADHAELTAKKQGKNRVSTSKADA
jgi:diguanylate cyclase (GGDEF)-like protein